MADGELVRLDIVGQGRSTLSHTAVMVSTSTFSVKQNMKLTLLKYFVSRSFAFDFHNVTIY